MNILLVDDHELFRSGLKFLLEELSEDVLFTEAATVTDALALAESVRPDLILLDFHMPGVQGLAGLKAVRERFEHAMIVVVSAEDQRGPILMAIDEGAAGFIAKSSSQTVMIAALRLVLAGGTYLPPHLLAHNGASTAQSQLHHLSDRQIDTLRLAVQGKANKVIARELAISEATVKAHLSIAFRVLGVRNRTEAVLASAGLHGGGSFSPTRS